MRKPPGRLERGAPMPSLLPCPFHPPVPPGEDIAAWEGSTAPPLESLPSKAPDGPPPVLFSSGAPVSPEASVASGSGGETSRVVEGELPSIYEIEALGLTPVTQGEDDPPPAGLHLSDITPAPLSPCFLPHFLDPNKTRLLYPTGLGLSQYQV
ncbi:hypothetical protein UY3_08905 [Chelonia mydas]|uniref:Uncharacterized protein n=1 Tax=Chelonia mydas TaxID=8469 RepID=M7BPM1_CHEMY|nr:hypothetical protein UY3_08905 [Chelonia mydas]